MATDDLIPVRLVLGGFETIHFLRPMPDELKADIEQKEKLWRNQPVKHRKSKRHFSKWYDLLIDSVSGCALSEVNYARKEAVIAGFLSSTSGQKASVASNR